MKLKVLLVNPWIYDFAAYNLWSAPLGLFRVAEYLSSFDAELSFIDCTYSFEIKEYGTGRFRTERAVKPALLRDMPRQYKRYGISTDEFVQKLKSFYPVDIVLLTCVMSYWYPGAQKAVEIIRDVMGNVPVALGGIYSTLYHDHACANSGANFIYRGPLDKNLDFALESFGFRLKRKRNPKPYYRLNLRKSYAFAPVLSSSGCPFMCPYCASNTLSDGYSRAKPHVVVKDITELCGAGIRDYAFYDDALLFEPGKHIKPLLRGIIGKSLTARFHTPNGLHARFIDEQLASLMKAANFRTIRLALETADEQKQKTMGNKVNNDEMARAIRCLGKEGFTKKELGVYLMYGLPGQPLKEVREGILFLKSLNVRIHLAEFSPIRGTELWKELVQDGVIDDALDPLLTNNTVFSYLYSGYDPEEIEQMKLLVKLHNEVV
ncbi:MAG TPA: B12-binding domain-containing radical SAM protein [Thermodesulfovibrionales bacterium]|nr:B12-binding domain-containing radical SAM protein [Thermodesulfovibrionales bacterium]